MSKFENCQIIELYARVTALSKLGHAIDYSKGVTERDVHCDAFTKQSNNSSVTLWISCLVNRSTDLFHIWYGSSWGVYELKYFNRELLTYFPVELWGNLCYIYVLHLRVIFRLSIQNHSMYLFNVWFSSKWYVNNSKCITHIYWPTFS